MSSPDMSLSQAVAALPNIASGGALPAAQHMTPSGPAAYSGGLFNGSSRIPSRKTTGRIASPFGTSLELLAIKGRGSGVADGLFPALADERSDNSATPPLPPLLANGSAAAVRRYSTAAGTRAEVAGSLRLLGMPQRPDRGLSNGAEGGRRSGLAVFPSLNEGSADSSNSAVSGERQQRLGSRSGRDSNNPAASGLLIQTNVGDGRRSRVSTGSAVSTPTTGLSSWLPFGNKNQQQQQQQPFLGIHVPRRPAQSARSEAAGSEAGSSGLLSSLWRNLSGGSNAPSRAGTRTGTMTEDDFGIERLAIGFAEVSGSLALAAAYVKPDQLDRLLSNGGTGSAQTQGKKDHMPIGGGLGGWVPSGGRAQKSVPLLICPPAVLFSELILAPGDSQTYSLRIQLPADLPPSFRGRTGCIAYDLVIVAKRDMLETSAHVARIPFRVLAYVSNDGNPGNFALERPIRMPPNSAQLTFHETASIATPRNSSPALVAAADEPPAQSAAPGVDAATTGGGGEFALLAGSELLQAALQGVEADMRADRRSVHALELDSDQQKTAAHEQSRRNIQAACQRRAPVSFALSLGTHALAALWLPRRVYQLGDMVVGRVDLHAGSLRVYHVSVWLESVEAVNTKFASYGEAQTAELTRKVVAERHAFCRSNRSLGFSLATPPAAAASFMTDVVSSVWQLRVELILSASAAATSDSDLVLSAVSPFPPSQGGFGSTTVPVTAPTSPTSPPAFVGRLRSSTMPKHGVSQSTTYVPYVVDLI
ncbi:Golgi membrane exchange factor (Ric1p-Rgp1p) subunit [Coemansia sp. Benny D115]|nr:Golgi membrane exchange factor (Ric1p-Rgp1p) subunit [Coemansia sp. Benny D115]